MVIDKDSESAQGAQSAVAAVQEPQGVAGSEE